MLPFINLHRSHHYAVRIETLMARGLREDQEDRIVVHHFDQGILLAVLDGHGGSKVAEYAAIKLPEILSSHFKSAGMVSYHLTRKSPDHVVKKAIRAAVKALSEGIKDQRVGSTLSLAFVEFGCEVDRSDTFPKHTPICRVTTAQLGDSIIAIDDGRHCTIAPTHTTIGKSAAKDLADIERRLLADRPGYKGFRVMGRYVYSVPEDPYAAIALTRALGDRAHYLSNTPSISTHRVSPDSLTLMLASDGLLDSLYSRTRTITRRKENQFIRSTLRRLKQGELPNPVNDNLSLVQLNIDNPIEKGLSSGS